MPNRYEPHPLNEVQLEYRIDQVQQAGAGMLRNVGDDLLSYIAYLDAQVLVLYQALDKLNGHHTEAHRTIPGPMPYDREIAQAYLAYRRSPMIFWHPDYLDPRLAPALGTTRPQMNGLALEVTAEIEARLIEHGTSLIVNWAEDGGWEVDYICSGERFHAADVTKYAALLKVEQDATRVLGGAR